MKDYTDRNPTITARIDIYAWNHRDDLPLWEECCYLNDWKEEDIKEEMKTSRDIRMAYENLNRLTEVRAERMMIDGKLDVRLGFFILFSLWKKTGRSADAAFLELFGEVE